MMETTHPTREQPNALRQKKLIQKENRNECIDQFFDEVDSNKIVDFITEESFQSFLGVIKKNALLIQKRLKPSGLTLELILFLEVAQCPFSLI